MSLRVSKPGFNIREKLNELDRPIGVQGNNILRSKTASESFEIIQAGRKNLIINGDMSVAQRGTYIDANTPSRTTGITGDTFGACDRWELDISSSGTWTQEQVKDAPLGSGFAYSSKMTCTTANTAGGGNTPGGLVSLRQKIEWGVDQNLRHSSLKGKSFTISFWVKSNEPGKYYVQVVSANNTASRRISRSYIIEQSGVWEFKTLTYPPDTINYPENAYGERLNIFFTVGANSNTYGSPHYGTWDTNSAYLYRGQTNLAAATGNYFQLTGVQLEKGPQFTSFEHLHYGENLALCQRYCYRIGGLSRAYQVVGNGFIGQNGSTKCAKVVVDLPTTMRTNPSVSVIGTDNFYGHTGAAFSDMTCHLTSNTGGIWNDASSGNQVWLDFGRSSGGQPDNGTACVVYTHNNNQGEVILNAEL